MLFDYELVHSDGKLRGDVESWPFTPTVIDLLGARRIAKGNMAALWHRAHVGADLAFSPRLKWQMGFGWYDVYPTAVLDSWRPAFLLFGRADEHRDELPFHRLQLIGVSLASQMSLGPLAISFGIQQIIPIRSEFGETIDPGGDQGGVEAEHVEPGEKSMWPNGTTLELYLQRTF
jgi:hypothetical protein